MKYHAIQCNTMQYHAIPCNTMQYHAIPCNILQYHASLITADGAYHCPVGSIMAIFIMVREGCFQNSRIAKTCQYFGRFDHDYSLLVCEKFPKNTPSICRTRQCAKIVVHGGGLSQFWQCHTFENNYSNHPSLFPYNKEKLFQSW